MNDLISRSALIKYLDETHYNDGSDWMVSQYNADWIYSWLESQPAVDAVPVVRCKDCEHWRLYEPDVDVGRCVKHNDHLARWDADYCSYGERRNGDG